MNDFEVCLWKIRIMEKVMYDVYGEIDYNKLLTSTPFK